MTENGDNHAALDEITAAQEAVLSQESPDLAVMLRLAVARDRPAHRGADTPSVLYRQAGALTDLVETLTDIGEPDRAEALVRSITDPAGRARALLLLAGASAPERAAHLTARALACGPWQVCLDGVARIDPAALSVLDDLFAADSSG